MIDNKCIRNSANLVTVFKSTVKHLGSKVIDIRQEAMRTFICMMKAMPNKEFIEASVEFLDSSNWRIREEILNLIIINILNKIDPDFDYQGLIQAMSKLVNDDNPKVRFVAREALAIMAHKGDREKVMDLCGQFIVHNEYCKIDERVNSEGIMTFNEKNLMFEYPKQPIKPRTLEKSKIKVNNSPEGIRNNRVNSKISNNNSAMKNIQPFADQSSPSNFGKTLDKKNKDTMISFDKSDYTDADSMFIKSKNKTAVKARKIRLKSLGTTASPTKPTKRSAIQSVETVYEFPGSNK